MKVRIALLLDTGTEKIVTEYSKMLSKELTTLFTLDNEHMPHVTLSHVEVDEAQLNELSLRVKGVVETFEEIRVETADVREDNRTYIGVYFNEEEEIIKLQEAIFQSIQDLILSSSTFRSPHITFTRMQDEYNVSEALQIVKAFPRTLVVFGKIALCDSQVNGTISRLFTVFPLN